MWSQTERGSVLVEQRRSISAQWSVSSPWARTWHHHFLKPGHTSHITQDVCVWQEPSALCNKSARTVSVWNSLHQPQQLHCLSMSCSVSHTRLAFSSLRHRPVYFLTCIFLKPIFSDCLQMPFSLILLSVTEAIRASSHWTTKGIHRITLATMPLWTVT